MNEQDQAFKKRLMEMFKAEAQEHIQALTAGLVALEKDDPDKDRADVLETIYREAHSLKGAARAVDMTSIESICQEMESIFAALKRDQTPGTSALHDLLYRAVDAIQSLLDAGDKESQGTQVTALVRQLREALDAGDASVPQTGTPEGEAPGPPRPSTEAETKPAPEAAHTPEERAVDPSTATVRVSMEKLDSIFSGAEELLSSRLALEQRSADLHAMQETVASWKKEWRKIQAVLKRTSNNRASNGPLQEFLDWNRHCMQTLEMQTASIVKATEHDVWAFGITIGALLEDMKQVLMLPFSSLLEVFPRFVRDLAREQEKEIDFVVRGDAIEVDRRILEGMKDPLMHLVRNGIHHGIETREERREKGKPLRGTLSVSIAQFDVGKVEIRIADDGRGIDMDRVRAAAVKHGIIAAEAEEDLDEQTRLALIFQSGVSTSPMITDISGRGLGLAIVREKVEALTGSISVDTEPGRGATFRIILPAMLATFRGVLVRVQDRMFVAPTLHVERALRIKTSDVKTVENRETVTIEDRPVALVRLAEILELSATAEPSNTSEIIPVIVLTTTTHRLGVAVDEVVQEQEVMVKSLGPQLNRVRNIAGATVLGNGAVVPILNIADVMASAVRWTAQGAPSRRPAEQAAPDRPAQRVLVAEDSITSRTLIKNILVSAGYEVETAVDGMDAWTKLHTGSFDLLVSDVDMPRLNGFGLTARIRGDRQMAELPVILVTALASREDREQGIDVGANAYIVKSSFDQSNLLDAVGRLI